MGVHQSKSKNVDSPDHNKGDVCVSLKPDLWRTILLRKAIYGEREYPIEIWLSAGRYCSVEVPQPDLQLFWAVVRSSKARPICVIVICCEPPREVEFWLSCPSLGRGTRVTLNRWVRVSWCYRTQFSFGCVPWCFGLSFPCKFMKMIKRETSEDALQARGESTAHVREAFDRMNEAFERVVAGESNVHRQSEDRFILLSDGSKTYDFVGPSDDELLSQSSFVNEVDTISNTNVSTVACFWEIDDAIGRYLGNMKHRHDIVTFVWDYNTNVLNLYTTVVAKASYMRRYHPFRSGREVSDSVLAKKFELFYSGAFRRDYLKRLYHGNVARSIRQQTTDGHEIKVLAALGDAKHRLDVVTRTWSITNDTLDNFVTAKSQAKYVKRFYPELLPPGNPNEHSISTVFEFNYESSDSFRSNYMERLYDGTLLDEYFPPE